VLILDDYAHHPVEISSTLKSIRGAIGERRLICVFQPHRYSRTQNCLKEYPNVFDEVDHLFVTDIYPGPGESAIEGLSAHDVVSEIKKKLLAPCEYLARSDLLAELQKELKPFDVIVLMSAGDLPKLSKELAQAIHDNPPKWTVGVVCGGKSAEHEVSLESVKYAINALDPALYTVNRFKISRDGRWLFGDERQHHGKKEPLIEADVLQELLACDLFLPMLHGPFGEDGMLQGFFETLGKPYIGCDYRSSAVAMDKVLTKRIAESCGIPTPPYQPVSLYEWKTDPDSVIDRIESHLPYPVFVKCSHLGSTLGVSKVESVKHLASAIAFAFQLDTQILVEKGISGREIEFAVLGNDVLQIPPPGEIRTAGQLYDYHSKYKPTSSMESIAPADLPPEIIEQGQKLAAKIYKAVGCAGLTRVDFFLDSSSQFWLLEINPMPGFTKNSMYPLIWKAAEMTPQELFNKLVILGLQRKRTYDRHVHPIESAELVLGHPS
jgi:UDP-N-acetylmuramate--alanine ligase